jgi:hypothetical protein
MRFVVAAIIVIVLGVVGALAATVLSAQETLRSEQFRICERGNLVRGYLLIRSTSVKTTDPRDVGLAADLLRLTDCEATRDQGATVYMSPARSAATLDFLEENHRLP